MKCSISTYYKILDAELYDFDDGYMQLNVDINAKSIDIEGYVSKQKKSISEMCNVPEENVIPISRLEYEAYTDERRKEIHMYSKCQKCGRKLTDPESIKRGFDQNAGGRIPGIHISEAEEDEQIDGQMSILMFWMNHRRRSRNGG